MFLFYLTNLELKTTLQNKNIKLVATINRYVSADFERSTNFSKAESSINNNFNANYNPLSLVSKAYGADRFENSPTLLNHMDLSASNAVKTTTSVSQPQVNNNKMKDSKHQLTAFTSNHNNSNSSFVTDHNTGNALRTNPLQLFSKIGGPLNFASNQNSVNPKEEMSKVQRGVLSQNLVGMCVDNVLSVYNIKTI